MYFYCFQTSVYKTTDKQVLFHNKLHQMQDNEISELFREFIETPISCWSVSQLALYKYHITETNDSKNNTKPIIHQPYLLLSEILLMS